MLNRRNFIAGAASSCLATAAPRSAKPNVLFLMSDQHQRRASGAYGNAEVHTPHIDALAQQSMRFERAYCQAPVCVPSRGSLITGLYPHRHGAKILQDPLPAAIPTLGHFFRERGYATAAIGKMHFVDEQNHHGFDYRINEADFAQTLSSEERERIHADQGGADAVVGRPSRLSSHYFQDNFFADQTVSFLHQNRERPFCLFSSFLIPHTPLVPLKEFFDLYRDAHLTLPVRTEHELEDGFPGNLIRSRERGWYTQTDAELEMSLKGYYGNVSQMDSYVGRVYQALVDLHLDQHTIVIYTSDHGEMAGAHRIWTKHNMYEQSVGVPLLISFPGQIQRNVVRSELIEQVDIFPTVAELCGFSAPANLHGRSFAGLLKGGRYEPRDLAYSEYYFCRTVFTKDDRYVGRPPMLMARTDRWKLVYLSWDRCELYDLHADPGEFHNCIDDPKHAGVVKELQARIERNFAA